jgi:hypothetical protein
MPNIRWTGVSGDWSTPSDWSANAVPRPPDRTVISAADSYAATVSTSETYAPSF